MNRFGIRQSNMPHEETTWGSTVPSLFECIISTFIQDTNLSSIRGSLDMGNYNILIKHNELQN